GFVQAGTGVVRYRGEEINHLPVHARSRLGIARTFQNLNLFSRLTVLENLMIPVDVRERRGVVSDALRAPRSPFAEGRAREPARAILHPLHRLHMPDVLARNLPVGLQARG